MRELEEGRNRELHLPGGCGWRERSPGALVLQAAFLLWLPHLGKGHSTGPLLFFSSPSGLRTKIWLQPQREPFKDTASRSSDWFHQGFSKISGGLKTSVFAHQKKVP